MTLTGFLLERIAEDEEAAQWWPQDGPWGRRDDKLMWMDSHGRPIYAPRSRVIAECEAKKRIVSLLAHGEFALMCHPEDEAERGHVSGIRKAVRLLAAVYADHPDYRDEWKP